MKERRFSAAGFAGDRDKLSLAEVCRDTFKSLEPELAARVKEEALDNYLADNLNAWELREDGVYRKLAPDGGAAPHSAQNFLLAKLCG